MTGFEYAVPLGVRIQAGKDQVKVLKSRSLCESVSHLAFGITDAGNEAGQPFLISPWQDMAIEGRKTC
jgi:hypothetical protein